MKQFNLFLIGVGGQGIGLLSEALIRAADKAGFTVCGVDTHGLAQRGGVVKSHIRIGINLFSPLIRPFEADLVIALERDEALRGMNTMAKEGGTVLYYDAAWQSLPVRLGTAQQVTHEQITESAASRKITVYRVFRKDLPDVRMQNVALLGALIAHNLIPNLTRDHVIGALEDLLGGKVLEKNLAVFDDSMKD